MCVHVFGENTGGKTCGDGCVSVKLMELVLMIQGSNFFFFFSCRICLLFVFSNNNVGLKVFLRFHRNQSLCKGAQSFFSEHVGSDSLSQLEANARSFCSNLIVGG